MGRLNSRALALAALGSLLLIAISLITSRLLAAREAGGSRPAAQAKLTEEDRVKVDSVVQGSNRFALNLYAELRAQQGNVFFSPYSISSALSMAYEGAVGPTAEEIQQVFGLPEDSAQRHRAFAALQDWLNPKQSSYQLSVANSFWAQHDHPFLPAYTDVLRQHYGSEATSLDIAADPEAARLRINDWVAGKTAERIKDLLPPQSLNTLTRLVLTNAIYFKGRWEDEFNPAATLEQDFRAPGGAVQVQMMRRAGEASMYAYAETDALQALELPYAGGRLAMLVLLPKSDALADLEQSLSLEALQSLQSSLQEQQVNVSLPRFSFSSAYMLNDALGTLGMPRAFGDSADFSGMDGQPGFLYISLVVHKAFVDVNEEGTEAAAATAVMMEGRAASPRKVPEFRADHPFLFFISDRQTGLILFVGRVEEPE